MLLSARRAQVCPWVPAGVYVFPSFQLRKAQQPDIMMPQPTKSTRRAEKSHRKGVVILTPFNE